MAKIAFTGGLDDLIRRRGISHPVIVPVLRNQILILLFVFFASTAFASECMAGIWFSAGFAMMTWILYSWASFFSHLRFDSFASAFLGAFVLRFLLRLLLLAAAVYALLVYAKADPMLLLAGVAVGSFAPLLTWAFKKGTK